MVMQPKEFGPWLAKEAKLRGRSNLAAFVGVSRPTLNGYIEKGWAPKAVMEKLGIRLVVDLENNS